MTSPSIHVVICPDDFLLGAATKEIVEALVPAEEREFGMEIVDGAVDLLSSATAALQSVRDAFSQTGLFSANKTVWLKNVSFFDAKRLADSKTFVEKLEEFSDWLTFSGVPEGSHLLISAPSIPKNSRFRKTLAALEKKGAAKLNEVGLPNSKTAGAQLRLFAKERGVALSAAVADQIVARVGTAPRMLVSELDKLLAYTAGAAPSEKDVEQICSVATGGEFWDLTDAFGDRDVRRTLKVFTDLITAKAEPVFLVMQLEARVNELWLAADSIAAGKMDASGRWSRALSEDDATAVSRLGKLDPSSRNPWAASKLASQSANWKLPELRRARRTLNTAHERLVTISGVDKAHILALAIAEAMV